METAYLNTYLENIADAFITFSCSMFRLLVNSLQSLYYKIIHFSCFFSKDCWMELFDICGHKKRSFNQSSAHHIIHSGCFCTSGSLCLVCSPLHGARFIADSARMGVAQSMGVPFVFAKVSSPAIHLCLRYVWAEGYVWSSKAGKALWHLNKALWHEDNTAAETPTQASPACQQIFLSIHKQPSHIS